MKLDELILKLIEVYETYGALECCYSTDEEGNGFKLVYYHPTVGKMINDDFTDTEKSPTHVCIT